jgi:hypothetical protein
LVDSLHELSSEFVPGTSEEAEAIWRCLGRTKDIESVVEALTRSTNGIDCVRQHLTAGEAGAHIPQVRATFAQSLDLDPSTLLPLPGQELPAALRRLQACGFGGAWTATEGDLLRRARALRGL